MNQLLWSWNYYTEKKNCALSTWQRNVYFTPRCAGNILMTSIKVKRVRDKIKQSCVWSRNFLLLKENNLPKKKKTFPITSDYHLCQDWSLGTSLAWNEDFAKNCVFFKTWLSQKFACTWKIVTKFRIIHGKYPSILGFNSLYNKYIESKGLASINFSADYDMWFESIYSRRSFNRLMKKFWLFSFRLRLQRFATTIQRPFNARSHTNVTNRCTFARSLVIFTRPRMSDGKLRRKHEMHSLINDRKRIS